jgi:hypothetical protein
VIGLAEAMALMVRACPGFRSPEADQLEGEDGAYVQVAALVRFVLGRLGEGDANPLDQAAAVAERVLEDGDEEAKTLIELGFVEDLTNRNLWPHAIGPSDLLAHLGPRALQTRWGWQLRLDADR